MTPPRLGVLDWGIGGLGFVRGLPPDTPICYLSDAGAPPYGTLDPAALSARLQGAMRWMASQRVTHLVVACNAASSVLDRTPPPDGMTVHGILDAGVRCALRAIAASPAQDGERVLGVIGGDRTIAADYHARHIRAEGWSVRSASGQPLSALVEAGQVEGVAVESAINAVSAALGPVDLLLLACTHYPALMPVLQARMPRTRLLDPVAVLLEEEEEGAWSSGGGGGGLRGWTTGDPALMVGAARRSWGVVFPWGVEGLSAEAQAPFWGSSARR